MDKPSFADRVRYAFDSTMSRGPIALIGWLALLSAVVIVVVAASVWTMGIAMEGSFADQAWAYMMHALGDFDPMSEAPWSFRLSTLVVTLTGIFVMSTLIGILTAGIEEKLVDLRKGRSKVVESGHTVILGWSPQVFSIIAELVVANENTRRPCVVVLGTEDKVVMEDAIRDQVGDAGRTRIVCRTGDPTDVGDLEIVSLNTAKSIIVLSSTDEDPDAGVIKTLLAITNSPGRRPEPYHIVAGIHHATNLEVARLAGSGEAELVYTGDLIARIMAQTCRQSGLSVVYTELLNFSGDEIYFQEEPSIVGKTFGDTLAAYEDSAVMGLFSRDGTAKLNPPMDTIVQAGDSIIAISEDDDTVVPSGLVDVEINHEAIRTPTAADSAPEHFLILGWNARGETLVGELDSYTAPGSMVTVATDSEKADEQLAQCRECLENQSVTLRRGNITSRKVLDALPFTQVNHVVLLSPEDGVHDPQKADACTLITLLHLRDIAEHLGRPFSIVSEMMDIRNRRLAEVARADDFVISGKLISLILSQISENKGLGPVFGDLFDPEGAEVYLKPAGEFVALEEPVNFYTVVESARRQDAVALGYRLAADAADARKAYGVVLNPDKSTQIAFSQRDRIIVLSES
jgi:voltage-gated potassium channel Kch